MTTNTTRKPPNPRAGLAHRRETPDEPSGHNGHAKAPLPLLYVTEPLRRALDEWCDGKRGRVKELAAVVGCDDSAITHIRQGNIRESRFVLPILKHTGIVVSGLPEPVMLEALDDLQSLDPSNYKLIRTMLLSMAEMARSKQK